MLPKKLKKLFKVSQSILIRSKKLILKDVLMFLLKRIIPTYGTDGLMSLKILKN